MNIELSNKSSRDAGSCNFCTDHITTDPPGMIEHNVRVVTIHTDAGQFTMRFCSGCFDNFIGALMKFLSDLGAKR